MAYSGLAYPVIADYIENKNGEVYYRNGLVLGKAMRVEISPVYEDISDYGDMNDISQEQEFSYADITLKVDNTAETAGDLLGFENAENTEIYSDRFFAKHIGLGLLMKRRQGFITRYSVLWLRKVKLWESESSNETKGDSFEYNTPEYTGRAYPSGNGTWKIKNSFETKNEALNWLRETAGMKGEE